MDQINKFYTGLLTSLGLSVEGGRVVISDEDGSKEVTVGDKVLVLPIKDILLKPDWTTQIPFHPLCENTLRGESEIQQELLTMIRTGLNVRLSALIWRLIKVASAGVDNKLNPDQAEFLPTLAGFDKEMVARFGKLIKQMNPEHYKTSFLHLNQNRRCKLGDKKYERVCLVRFPLADAGREEKPYSVLRVKDFDALRGLMSYILPDWDLENTYSVGTDTKVAPYFTSLVTAYHQINKRFSEIAQLFVGDFPEFGALINDDTEWWSQMGALSKMRDSLPSYEGCEGSLPKGGSTTDAPIISDPTPARGITIPVPKAKESLNLPWEETTTAAPAQETKRRQDDAPVEYVPRQAQPAHAPVYPGVAAAPIVPAGYAVHPHNGGTPTFHQLRQAQAQSLYGHNTAIGQSYVAPVGGSPFAGGPTGQSHLQPQQPSNQYGVTYVAAGAPVTQPQGRGF